MIKHENGVIQMDMKEFIDLTAINPMQKLCDKRGNELKVKLIKIRETKQTFHVGDKLK